MFHDATLGAADAVRPMPLTPPFRVFCVLYCQPALTEKIGGLITRIPIRVLSNSFSAKP
jgi:hypothetical protein